MKGIPHFVYTDNTMLANLRYDDLASAFPKGTLPVTRSWIEAERHLYRNADACFVMSENVRVWLLED